jgi:hypothetical protein
VQEMLGLRADGISQEETQSENLQTQAAKTHEGESTQEALALQDLIRRGLQTAPAGGLRMGGGAVTIKK